MSQVGQTAFGAEWRRFPLVRLLASIKFGVTVLVLVLAYACVLSALAPVRGALEVTEMEAFAHWLFTVLIVVMCLSVATATLVRIPLNLVNLGVWTVHVGILLLCGGAIWYFGTKIEGDVPLRSPRIELVINSGGRERPVTALLAAKGESWSTQAPVFGGEFKMTVAEVKAGADGVPTQATVRIQAGETAAKDYVLDAAGTPVELMAERLSLRMLTFPPERHFYDNTAAALYYRKVSDRNWQSVPLDRLPYFRERYLDEGYAIVDSAGRSVQSKRTTPELDLGFMKLPTGWFEPWRLQATHELPGAPFDVEVTGYLPYIAGTRVNAVGGGSEINPAVNVRLSAGADQTTERALLALSPARSAVALETPVEFRWVASAAERDALLKPLAGPNELVIEVKDPPVTKTYAVSQGQTIEVEGTSYKLVVQQLFPSWPLMSPGFENSTSPAALVEVTSSDKKFTRTVIQRYPELSQDIDEAGMRRKEGPYDPNITLRFRSSQTGYLLLIGEPTSLAKRELTLGVFNTRGGVEAKQIAVGRPARAVFMNFPVEFTVLDLFERGRLMELPVVEPLETRRPNISARSASALRLTFKGGEDAAAWSESRWMEFSQYPHIDARPLRFRPPGADEDYELIYTRQAHDLGAALTPGRLIVTFFPGQRSVERWRSEFLVHADGEPVTAGSVQTNSTHVVGNWTLFQSGAATDHWSYTILGVGNRGGVWPMLLGCTLITLGSTYAFYVKPALKRRRAERAAERVRDVVGGKRGERELVHAREGVAGA